MGSVISLNRRLAALEGSRDPLARFHAMSDEELRARMVEVEAQLRAGGLDAAPGFLDLPWGQQQAWLQRMRVELGG